MAPLYRRRMTGIWPHASSSMIQVPHTRSPRPELAIEHVAIDAVRERPTADDRIGRQCRSPQALLFRDLVDAVGVPAFVVDDVLTAGSVLVDGLATLAAREAVANDLVNVVRPQ